MWSSSSARSRPSSTHIRCASTRCAPRLLVRCRELPGIASAPPSTPLPHLPLNRLRTTTPTHPDSPRLTSSAPPAGRQRIEDLHLTATRAGWRHPRDEYPGAEEEELLEAVELRQCSSKPRLEAPSGGGYPEEDIARRCERWASRREALLRRERGVQAAKELEDCTFTPNVDLPDSSTRAAQVGHSADACLIPPLHPLAPPLHAHAPPRTPSHPLTPPRTLHRWSMCSPLPRGVPSPSMST